MTDQSAASDTATAVSAVELIQQLNADISVLQQAREIVLEDRGQHELLQSWLYEQEDGDLTAALGNWVLAQFEDAEPAFELHKEEPRIRPLWLSTLVARGRAEEALQAIGTPRDANEALICAQAFVRAAGHASCSATQKGTTTPADVDRLLANPGAMAETAALPFLEGWKAEQELRIGDAITKYTEAYEQNDRFADCAFHLARLLELKGCDERALEIYEEYLRRQPPNPAILVNLGVLYEDIGEYTQAETCLRAVLKADPTHERARLFLGDVTAAKNMLYDEDQERREDKRNAILRTPVTDFELSVRSRNCLAKMGIRTLGDLVCKTEPELLSYKNFGETSLMEIQQILTSKNLRLGMDQDELLNGSFGPARQPVGDLSDPRNRPIAELELSVRSRRVVDMFKLRVIGDLCVKTEAELMACPNFGQTSLNEIRTKLDDFGLALKG